MILEQNKNINNPRNVCFLMHTQTEKKMNGHIKNRAALFQESRFLPSVFVEFVVKLMPGAGGDVVYLAGTKKSDLEKKKKKKKVTFF